MSSSPFQEYLAKIQANLHGGKCQTSKVYEASEVCHTVVEHEALEV